MKIFSRNALKYIAAAAMLIDHIAMFFVPVSTSLGFVMRFVGRLTAPVMCMFLAEGYACTSSKARYGLRLFVFAVISQLAYAFSHGLSILTADFNVIFTLFLCFAMLHAYERIGNEFLKYAVMLACVGLSYFGDWGIIAPLWVFGFYFYKGKKEKQTAIFCIVSVLHILSCTFSGMNNGYSWYSCLWQTGVFLFVPLLFLYNGESGRKTAFSKWFFYLCYPVHLVILEAVSRIFVQGTL